MTPHDYTITKADGTVEVRNEMVKYAFEVSKTLRRSGREATVENIVTWMMAFMVVTEADARKAARAVVEDGREW